MDTNKCRICLTSIHLKQDIFKTTNSGQIYTKIMSLAKVQIQPNDGLPTFICTNCNKRLEICLEFVQLCEKSDKLLRDNLITILKDESSTADVKKRDSHICQESTNLPSLIEGNNEKELKIETNEVTKTSRTDTISNNISNLNLLEKISQKQQCFTCGKIMSSRFRLKTHLATHSGEKPYACTHCDKKFTIAQNLNVHMRIHTGEKPFNCSLCGQTFAQSSGLTAHKRKHTGQTPYQCLLCPRSFRTIGHLQYHIRCHTGEKNYECDTCSHAFITRSDLKQHLLTHIGDKLHVCCICGMRLSRASNLKRHMKFSHNEGKTFTCAECSLKFDRKSELLKHEKIHKYVKNK